MLKVVESESGLMIVERPIAQWIISAAFSLLLLSIVVLFVLFSFPQDFKDWLLVTLFTVTGIASAFAAVTGSATTIHVARKAAVFTVTRKSLLTTRTNSYEAAETPAPASVEVSTGTRGSRFYCLTLKTREGSSVELTTSVMKNERAYFDAADAINRHLSKLHET